MDSKKEDQLAMRLIEAALEARDNAYTPYSRYSVGAAIHCIDDDSGVRGCNVENASFGATNCAERTALFAAIAQGHREFDAIAIVAGPADYSAEELEGVKDYPTPCGICRQALREFVHPDTFRVILAKSITDYKVLSLSDLLPESFGPENMPR